MSSPAQKNLRTSMPLLEQIEQPPYQFTLTQDWFSHNIPHWLPLFPLILENTPNPRVLEIGSWEGRSAVFLLTNLCSSSPASSVTCIDHFDLFRTYAGRSRFERINHNLRLTGQSFRVLAQFSVPALMSLLEEEMTTSEPGFDWVYIDGSHEADDTFLDGELAWRLARKGAVVIFDDYHWDKEPEDSMHHPKRGIDGFLALHQGEYEQLSDPEHYQVVLKKTTEMRIGFLVPDALKADSSGKLNEALGYGIHIALTVDTAYAMGAAVTMRSAVEHTPDRLTFYVINCGLTEEDKDKLRTSLPESKDVTVVFLSLPEESLAKELGPVWAKLDMYNILPVERVLYLDADVLVRSSLKELWDTDLEWMPLAACSDIGHPMGHDQVPKRAYFNAGVMLMDLARVRLSGSKLEELARQMRESKFRDQDVLNVHFVTWKPLSLKWNAQGLGTYARYPSQDRDTLELADMNDPAIVHFTGPVHPSLVEVLNPYVQPPTAKPWGYLGAPEHPFQYEWWSCLERTCWKDVRTSVTWNSQKSIEMKKAVDRAARDFKKVLDGADM